jgi:[protein-PII] uridylyltransferase
VSLRAALDAMFATLPPRLEAHGTGGAAARAISDLYDAEIRARFDEAKAGIAAPLALVATGGWARRELAPYSDIDFIVLHERDEASAKQLADKLLYPLWDEKLAIGHAIREARATARLAREDLATATALLDARHIAGDRRLTTDLMRATLGALAPGGNPNDFIAMLAAEQKGRHERFGASLYLLEPNLKQGIGALRDLSTALWAAQVRWHPPRPGEDPPPTEAVIRNLVGLGHLTRRQGDVLANARDFMLRIRTLVQLAAKRRFDQLTFEIQEALGPRLYPHARPHEGDIRSAVAPAVEALMRDYYLHAREVVQVTDHLLDSARVPARRKPRIAPIDGSFITFNGELAIKDPRLFADRPSEMVRLFRVAVAEQLPVYGHTRELIAEAVSREPEALGRDPRAARLLLEALADIRDRAQPSALEVMHQLGLVSAIIPEWKPCTARVQHDLYHVYTVDQHQLYAVAMQKRLARGELAQEHPLATDLWKEVRRPASLLLGTLLHDVGKPLGKGHAEKGAVVTRNVAARLGMSDADGELAEFLVRQHLTMSHLSQRRDLSDPEVIARFAERVGDDEHLVQLYLVTLCDTAMTAPDNLNAWKDGLLRDLLLRTREHFRAGSPEAATQAEAAAREKAIQIASDGMSADAARTAVDGIDPRLFVQLTPRQAARQVKLASVAQNKQPPVAIEVHGYPMKGHSEVAIVAPDAPGVLAVIAGALTASRVDVLGAVLGHIDFPKMGDGVTPAGGADHRLVLDTFYVRDLKGEAISDDDPRWTRLIGDLRELLAGEPDPTAVASLIAKRRPKSALPPRVTPGVPTEIRIHDDSTQATIVEVFTRDRVGVLYAITQTLADLGLDISLAKVSTEGEKVADVFYVTRAGKRLTDKALRAVLVERLRMAVEAPGLTGS